MGRKRKVLDSSISPSTPAPKSTAGTWFSGDEIGSKGVIVVEGNKLNDFLENLGRELESAKALKAGLPEKIWIKEHFAVGINEATRVLERMPSLSRSSNCSGFVEGQVKHVIPLQAILVAVDCIPKWLTKHFPSLASSRGVPVICIKDNKVGSLRLGQLLKLKTAAAIGVKDKNSSINNFIAKTIATAHPITTQ